MNKLLVALVSAAVASVAAAQTAPPLTTSKERQQAVQATTEGSANANTGATTAKQQAVNVQKSKQVSKLSKEEKANLAKEASKANLNPENSSGAQATAVMQKQTTAESKATPKQNTGLKTKEGKQDLAKELQKNATP